MPEPGQIQVLSDGVINKIAAGEVVERPASVVKELVENALDAGATQVQVEVVAGGRNSLLVTDNGRGMNHDDALLSVERHATSKIRDVDDIERIATLGFRGEALAAIASVSRFELQTCRSGETVGTELLIAGGRIQEVRDAGCPPGTRIAVRHLFFNVPARRKFLRAEATELGHVRQTFLLYALSHPEVGWRLVADGREVYALPPAAGLEDRVRALFGAPVAAALRPVRGGEEGLSLRGLVGLPAIARGDRNDQYLFINGRPATAPVLQYALAEAYHTLLPRGRYPVVFLFLDLRPEEVDVNVHPTKREVRFRESSRVRDLVLGTVRSALLVGEAETPRTLAGEPASAAAVAPPAPSLQIVDLPAPRTFQYPRWSPPVGGPPRTGPAGLPPAPAAPVAPAAEGRPWSWCRVVGQVGGLFVVLETAEGLVLMDPHAAHERVLFEKYMREILNGAVKSQGMLLPETIPLGPADARVVRRNLDALRAAGFGLAEFGGDTFVLDAVPAVLGAVSGLTLLRDAARSLDEGGPRGGIERWAEERIAQSACKAAVKARDRLTLDEIEKLVVALASAEMPYTCPHGRPTLMHFSYDELYRKFGRTG
jgi:DNA mismatch repair protein MutL